MIAAQTNRSSKLISATATLSLSFLLACSGCSGSSGQGGTVHVTAPNVKLSRPLQTIDGFGVNTAWLSPPSNTAAKAQVYDALFSVSKGIGLSMIRHRIPFRENPKYDDKFLNKNDDGTYKTTTNADGSKTFDLNWSNWDLSNTARLIADIKAQAPDYPLPKIVSTPWTPPNNSVSKWKVPDGITSSIDYVNAPEVGGSLSPDVYADYADLLADYVLGFSTKMTIDLTALSLQNEPNFKCDYESANWTAAQFHDFLAVLNTEFAKKGVSAKLPELKIIAPDFANVEETLVLPTLADPATAPVLGILGVHEYGFGPWSEGSYTVPVMTQTFAAGKPVWMTEWSTAAWGPDTSMTNGMRLARLIHMDMTIGKMSAFLYWWGWGDGKNTLLVVDNTTWQVTLPKRYYVLGQWARFVRPDFVHVETDAPSASNALLSAFKSPAGDQVVMVAVNTGKNEVTLPLWTDTGSFGTLTAYRTSAADDENLTNVGTIDGGANVTVTLPATSVTTLVGAIAP